MKLKRPLKEKVVIKEAMLLIKLAKLKVAFSSVEELGLELVLLRGPLA